MRRSAAVAIVAVAVAARLSAAEPAVADPPAAESDWQARILRTEPLPAGCGSLRVVAFTSAAPGALPFSITVAALTPGRTRARIVDQPEAHPEVENTVAGITRRSGAAVAINGGYFMPGFVTDGLCIVAHARLSPFKDAAVLSGVIAIDDNGALTVRPRADPGDVAFAIQAGPFLVDPGGTLGIRKVDAARRRSALALAGHGQVLALVASPVPLIDLAWVLCHRAESLGAGPIERALNLDGGPSSGLALSGALSACSVAELGAVRNVVVFTPVEKER